MRTSIYKLKTELRAAYRDLDLACEMCAGPLTLLKAQCRIAALEDELARAQPVRDEAAVSAPRQKQIGVYRGGC